MSDKPSLQDLLEVQAHFGLPSPALVEKDWHVVKALAAITAVDTAPLRLVFGGGTALSRAHPMAETLRAIEALEADPGYAGRYAGFCRDMVYGDTVEYAACLGTLSELARLLQHS